MILGIYGQLPVGEKIILKKVTDKDKKLHFNIPAFVIKEVSSEEYLKFLESEGCKLEVSLDGASFYEISID